VGLLAMAFDGANMWIAASHQTILKMRANDNAVIGTFHVDILPDALAYDGANIWVVGEGSFGWSKCEPVMVRFWGISRRVERLPAFCLTDAISGS
jgi:hypothetical protein